MILTNTDAELVRVREQLFVSHAFHVGVVLRGKFTSTNPLGADVEISVVLDL